MTSRLLLTVCSLTLVFTSGQLGIAPKAEALLASEKAKADKTTQEVDLSGVWLQGEEEWQIRHNPCDGTITILDPIKHLAGRYAEYTGTIKGDTITATYRVTDPAVFNPQLPEKVRREHVKDQPTWSLKLRITKEGKLEGAKGQYRVSYNQKSLKINRITPETKKITLAKKPSLKGPPDKPGEPSEEEAQRQADELRRIAEQAVREASEAQQRETEAGDELERVLRLHEEARRELAEAERLYARASEREQEAMVGYDVTWNLDPDDPRRMDAVRRYEAARRVLELRRRELDAIRERIKQMGINTGPLPEINRAGKEALERYEQAQREANEARARARNALRAAREAQGAASKLGHGPDHLGGKYMEPPVPEPGRSPVTPPPSPGTVRP